MSRRIWGVLLTVLALIMIISLMSWYFLRDTSTPPEEQRGTELVEMMPVESRPEHVNGQLALKRSAEQSIENTAAADDTAAGYQFKLVNDNNYVTVYQLPENELYEYTDVIMDVLPVELQEEIQHGKYLKNEEELYNFLENYTS